MSLISEKFKNDYQKYMDEFESSDFMDIDAHTKWSLSVGGLIKKVGKVETTLSEVIGIALWSIRRSPTNGQKIFALHDLKRVVGTEHGLSGFIQQCIDEIPID
jgi:hypothetical protein